MQKTPPAAALDAGSSEREGLWSALLLDGSGGALTLDWEAVERWKPDDGPLWIHLDPTAPRAMAWLREKSQLSPDDVDELLRDELRPRLEPAGPDAMLLSLRGLAPELDGDSRDLTILHLRVEPRRMISTCDRILPGATQALARFERRQGANDIASLILSLGSWLATSLQITALALEDPVVEVEYDAELGQSDTSARVRSLQGRVTRLRRHLAPFKVILRRALDVDDCWFARGHVSDWRNLVDQTQDTDVLLQSLHQRLTSVHDYVGERLARSMNYVLYLLTIFSTILMPLTFITGIFGMNVGIHGGSYRFMDSTIAFLAVLSVLFVLAWFGYRLVKSRHMLPPRDKRLSDFRP